MVRPNPFQVKGLSQRVRGAGSACDRAALGRTQRSCADSSTDSGARRLEQTALAQSGCMAEHDADDATAGSNIVLRARGADAQSLQSLAAELGDILDRD